LVGKKPFIRTIPFQQVMPGATPGLTLAGGESSQVIIKPWLAKGTVYVGTYTGKIGSSVTLVFL